MKLWSFVCVFAAAAHVKGQSSICRTPSGETGNCQALKTCSPLKNLSDKRVKTPEDIQLLRESACGLTPDGRPKICCPTDWDSWTAPSPKPTTPTPSVTRTKPPVLKPATTVAPTMITKIQATSVGNVPPNPVVSTIDDCSPTIGPPEPDCCGNQTPGNRILGGTITDIGEYPWMALIEYERELVYKNDVIKSVQTLCGGSLISSRYVLTAAHCIKSSWGPITKVRLAEYDTSSSGKDCVQTKDGDQACIDVVLVPVEKTCMHPQYSPKDENRRHDIGLLKLKFAAPYTDFVRPICLPSKDITINPPPNLSFFAAGWGYDGTAFSKIKLDVSLPYMPMQDCQSHYAHGKTAIAIWNKQICAGGEQGSDTCGGDSGGPLMYENGPDWEAAGIVSFGPTLCGQKGVPGVYTNVYQYLDWIKSEMKP